MGGSQVGAVLPPRQHLAVSRDISVSLQEECYGHLVDRGQGCCYMSYNAQDSPFLPDQRVLQMSRSTEAETVSRA